MRSYFSSETSYLLIALLRGPVVLLIAVALCARMLLLLSQHLVLLSGSLSLPSSAFGRNDVVKIILGVLAFQFLWLRPLLPHSF